MYFRNFYTKNLLIKAKTGKTPRVHKRKGARQHGNTKILNPVQQ